jgi:hypothetical protein
LLDDADAATARATLGVTPGGATNEIQKNNGSTGFTGTKVFSSSNGDMTFGDTGLAGNRTITATGSASEVDLVFSLKSTVLGTTSERMRITSEGDVIFPDNTTIEATGANLTLDANVLNIFTGYTYISNGAGIPSTGPSVANSGVYFGTDASTNEILQWVDNDDETYDLRTQSGTYTPTITNVANVASSTAFECQWMRVGDVVTVSGKVVVDPTAATLTRIRMTLPIASDFGAEEDAAGTAGNRSTTGESGVIFADSTNDEVELRFTPSDTASNTLIFHYTYNRISPPAP